MDISFSLPIGSKPKSFQCCISVLAQDFGSFCKDRLVTNRLALASSLTACQVTSAGSHVFPPPYPTTCNLIPLPLCGPIILEQLYFCPPLHWCARPPCSPASSSSVRPSAAPVRAGAALCLSERAEPSPHTWLLRCIHLHTWYTNAKISAPSSPSTFERQGPDV